MGCILVAEITADRDVIDAINRFGETEMQNVPRKQRRLGFITPQRPTIQAIKKEEKGECKNDDISETNGNGRCRCRLGLSLLGQNETGRALYHP